MLIYLANLTHIKDGRPSSEVIPLNIGFLASYVLKHFPGRAKIKIFNIPEKLEKELNGRIPDVLACSNYIWNFKLNYLYLSHYKSKYPRLVTVMGGPNYPGSAGSQDAFLKKYKDIDFYIYMDGEKAFLNLIRRLSKNNFDIQKAKKTALKGCHCLSKGRFINGGMGQRLKDSDAISSPYLTGLFDEMLKDGFIPVLQTNKGCPFSCAYCCSGNQYYNKIYRFPLKRLFGEIEYINKIAKAKTLQIADDNYGIFRSDILVSRKLHECREKLGWPLRINLSTSKVNKDRVFEAVVALGDAIFFSASMQSMNKKTLDAIRRKNLPFTAYREIINKLLDNNVYSLCELIIGLPEETKESYLRAVREAIDTNIKNIDSYTCMLLKNTSLSEDSYYDKFKMQRRFRVLPRDYGVYLGQRVVETEEVCVATRTLFLDDYIYMRGFSFVVAVYHNLRVFEELFLYMKSLKISAFDILTKVHQRMPDDAGVVGKVYRSFARDSRSELWESERELLSYFSQEQNFSKLLQGELGANLIQQYQAVALDNLGVFADFIFGVIVDNYPRINKAAALDILNFIKSSRGDLFNTKPSHESIKFSYDIPGWFKAGMSRDIHVFRKDVSLRFFMTKKQTGMIKSYLDFFGASHDARGKILTRINPTLLFKNFDYADKEN